MKFKASEDAARARQEIADLEEDLDELQAMLRKLEAENADLRRRLAIAEGFVQLTGEAANKFAKAILDAGKAHAAIAASSPSPPSPGSTS